MIIKSQHGASLVEVLLAVAVFGLLVTAVTGAIIYGQQSSQLAAQRTRAAHIANEGSEAVRAIRDENFSLLAPGTYGLAIAANKWTLVGSPDVVDGFFTRSITIATVDAVTRSVTVNVSWQQNPQRTGTSIIPGQLTNWRVATVVTAKGGMLVYGDGGTTTDTLRYRLLNGTTGLWSAVASTADVDILTTNKAARMVRVYASKTRNEKIILSRHSNGTAQFIYAQVWNGTAWGSVQQLSTWGSITGPALENFDGAYQDINGNFTVVYSDNTTTPKTRTWNGTTWSAQSNVAAAALAGIPNFIILKTRPNTNELFLAILDSASDTRTNYYSGSTWTSPFASRATTAQSATTRLVDFEWSLNNPLLGELVFSDSTNDTTPATMLFTANGTGGVTAGAKISVSPAQGTNAGSFTISARAGTTEWQWCNKASQTTTASIIRCYTINSVGALSAGTQITATTAATAQRTFDVDYESQASGNFLVNVYSDNTATPKLKKFNPSTATWDGAATSLSALGAGILRSVRTYQDTSSNDIVFLTANANLDLWTTVWNGTTDAVYTTPAGKAFSAHGISGSANTEFWFDYAWDRF